MTALASGRVFPLVRLEVINEASGQPYYEVKLENVLVSSCSIQGGAAGAPVDAAKLRFGRMTWTAIPQDPTQPPTMFHWSRGGP